MSDFFSGIYGAKFPEVVMNSGPLPPQGGLPAPLHDTADARINYNSTLLGNIQPYAYGEPGFLSSQVSYVNQPHRIQKIVPPLRLPTPQVNTEMTFEISHAVDDSDVAFVMRLDRGSTVCSMMSSRSTHYHKVGTNVDAFINLATLNYLLAGLQLCYVPSHPQKSRWSDLLYDLDKYTFSDVGRQLTLWDLRYIVRDLIVPFGVVRGSEKQGGQDETGLSAATWPVNFVTSMVLDGHDRNVLNYWHYHDLSAGDDLVFRLKPMPLPKGKSAYTLNHYYKGFVQQNFESYLMQRNLGHPLATHVWQLVPDVFTLDHKPENDANFGEAGVIMHPGFEVPRDYVWQEHGYWHIARSQVMVRKYATREYYNDDMANQLKVSHLDLTFEPAYCKAPGESRDPGDDRTVTRDRRRRHQIAPVVRNERRPLDRTRVAPGMASGAGDEPWAPRLHLEGLVGELPAAPWETREREAAPPAYGLGMEIAAALDPCFERRVRFDLGTRETAAADPAPQPQPQPQPQPAAPLRQEEDFIASLVFSHDDDGAAPQQQAETPAAAEATPAAEGGGGYMSALANSGAGRARKRKQQDPPSAAASAAGADQGAAGAS